LISLLENIFANLSDRDRGLLRQFKSVSGGLKRLLSCRFNATKAVLADPGDPGLATVPNLLAEDDQLLLDARNVLVDLKTRK
jgi:hypothetical protein